MACKSFINAALRLAVLVMFVFVGAVACDSYDDTKASDAAKSYYQTENMLIEGPTLKAWVDNGYKTEKGEPVVILNAGAPGSVNYIPGSITLPDGLTGGLSRSDGPMSVGNQVYDGATMDKNIRYAGIEKDTVIVLTANWASGVPNAVTRMWWVFYYWGFADTKLKVLNGGNQAYAAAGGAMAAAPNIAVTPSTFSVKDLPGNRIDLVREPFGAVHDDAANGVYARKDKIIVSTLATDKCYGDNNTECVPSSVGVIGGRVHGGIQVKTQSGDNALFVKVTAATGDYYVYKSAEDLAKLFVDDAGVNFLPEDKNFRIITHCGSGQSTTVAYFALRAILGYTNSAIYDGSLSEWNAMSAYRYDNRTSAGGNTAATASFYVRTATTNPSYVQWDKSLGFFADKNGNIVTDGRIILYTTSNLLGYTRWDTSMITDYLTFGLNATSTTLTDPLYDGSGREINDEDKLYQQGTDNIPGGSGSQNGNAGAGC